MNKTRRKALDSLRDKLLEFQSSALEIKEQLDALREEEQEAYDNMPESLQNSEKGLAMNSGIDSLDSVVLALEEIDTQFGDAVEAIENATNSKKEKIMATDRKLLLDEFVRKADMDELRILHHHGGWLVRSGNIVLMRPCGNVFFSCLMEALEVLASVGIRYSTIEWDGVLPRRDEGRVLPDGHLGALPK